MAVKKAAPKAPAKTSSKKCSSTYGGGGVTKCNQTEGHDGPHTCSDLTWN
jgi:hypothetical protein